VLAGARNRYSAEGVTVDDAERLIKQVLDQPAGLDRQRADGAMAGMQTRVSFHVIPYVAVLQ
jgi:hypothetical protein